MIQEEVYGASLSILLSLYPKNFSYSLGGYSHRERCRSPDRKKSTKEKARNFGSIANKINIDYSHWEIFMKVKEDKFGKLHILNQSNKAAKYNSRVASSRQNLNVVVEIYHEGKTLGSVLCGLVYAHGCALLVCICVYDAKKNPGGRTGYPENHWDSFFISPKCGKRMGLSGFPNSNPRGLNLK
jgi:hypothetical protein